MTGPTVSGILQELDDVVGDQLQARWGAGLLRQARQHAPDVWRRAPPRC